MMAKGGAPRGAGGVEKMVPAKPFVAALRERGIQVKESVTFK
jgi:hypothetical protein